MHRRGTSILELMVAAVLLALLMTMCLQILALSAAQGRAAEDRQLAIQEASNQMERLAAVPWDELTPERVEQVKVSQCTSQSLPGAVAKIQLDALPEEPDAKRIAVTVRWSRRSGEAPRQVRLVAWRYRR